MTDFSLTQDGFLSVSPLKVYVERDDFNENYLYLTSIDVWKRIT